MLLEVEGIVLSETPYGETSKIINLYTKEKGLIGIMCKGAKSMKSMFRASTQVLSYGVFNLHYKEDVDGYVEFDKNGQVKRGSTDSIEYMHAVWKKGFKPDYTKLVVI